MHVMIDLETMGTTANAAIVSIGACCFDRDGLLEDGQFYRTITLASSMQRRAHIDPETVIWWMKQGDDARAQLTGAGSHIDEALQDFSQWINDGPELEGIWGNGASFDNVILTHAYKRSGMEVPWKFWLDRCYRTVKSLSDVGPDRRQGTHHNALDDAIFQAQHLVKIWQAEA